MFCTLLLTALAVPVPATDAPTRIGTADLRHGGVVRALAFSPDGMLLASAGHDRLVSIWDASTGREVARCAGHEADVTSLAWSPDGNLLASGAADGTVRLWGAKGPTLGVSRHTFTFKADTVGAVAFSPDGKRLAVGGDDGRLLVVEVTSRRTLTTIERFEGVRCLAWANGGKWLVANGGKGAATVYDVAKANAIRSFAEESIGAVAVSGDRLATWEPGGVVRLYDAKTLTAGRSWPMPEAATVRGAAAMIYQIAFDRDGKRLAAGGTDGDVRVWAVDQQKPIHVLKGHTGRVTAVAIRGEVLASAGADSTIRLWDLKSGKPRTPAALIEQPVRGLSADRTGRYLAVLLDGGTVKLWDRESKRFLDSPPADAHRAVFTATGELLALERRSGALNVWSRATGKSRPLIDRASLRDVALSRDGKVLATSEVDGSLWVRSADGKPRREVQAREKRLTPVLSPSGGLVAALTGAARVGVWDGHTGRLRQMMPGHRGGAAAAAFSADERLLITGGRDRMVRFWEVDTGRERYSARGQAGDVTAVAVSPDGKLIASGSADGAVQVRSVRGGLLLRERASHRGPVSALVFLDDRTLASAGVDTSVMIWGVPASAHRPATVNLAAEERDRLWGQLRGEDAPAAALAQEKLALGGEGVLGLVRRDVSRIERQRTRLLIAQLEDGDFDKRKQAHEALVAIGPVIEEVLRKALADKPSLDLHRRLEQLLADVQRAPSGDALRALRSVEVLEMLGSPRARYLLLDLASGVPEAELTRRARSALGRLEAGGP